MSSTKALPSLQGCRVALTVAKDDPASAAVPLIEREATILYYPVAQTFPPDSYDELDAAINRCREGTVDWLLFTTPRAVEATADRIAKLGKSEAEMSNVKLASYGARTRQSHGTLFPKWQISLYNYHSHHEIVDAMQLSDRNTVVVPCTQRTRTDWQRLLAASGASVMMPPAYRLILGRGGDDLPGALWGGLVDAVVFLTENSVRHFVIRLKVEGGSLDMLGDVVVACLDPQTADAAKAYGLNVQVTPAAQTVNALAEDLAIYFNATALELPKV